MKKHLLLVFISFLFFGCSPDEYSPNQIFNSKTARDVNDREIKELPIKAAGSEIKIAVTGDTQRSYKETQDFVDYLNKRTDIDFVILNGDISDFGLLLEFDGVYQIYNKLKVPFITVVGNHDLVANGGDVYKRMFGPYNFTFNYAGVKFVCHDTNGREYNFDGSTPNLNWLNNNLKLEAGTNHVVAFSHVPPNDGDFDPALVTPYQNLMNQTQGILASIHSHRHTKQDIFYQNGKGVPFIVTKAIIKKAFSLITIKNGQLDAQEINF